MKYLLKKHKISLSILNNADTVKLANTTTVANSAFINTEGLYLTKYERRSPNSYPTQKDIALNGHSLFFALKNTNINIKVAIVAIVLPKPIIL